MESELSGIFRVKLVTRNIVRGSPGTQFLHMSDIQDALILCEIFEQRSILLQNLFKFNPRKCNSASSFSGNVQRNKIKCNIVLPTDAKKIRLFEKTLIGGYSCVNTRMAFDTELILKDKKN